MKQLRIARNIVCGALFLLIVIPLAFLYKIEEGYNMYRNRKKRMSLDKEGRVTYYNPYTDKW